MDSAADKTRAGDLLLLYASIYCTPLSAMSVDAFFHSSHIFHRSFERKPLRVVSASGLTLTLDDGRTIIDATGGPAVTCLGHNVPEVTASVTDQLSMSATSSRAVATTHPVACAAALAVQEIVGRDRLISNVRDMGPVLSALLQRELGGHPLVGNIRGRGLFWAVEFMRDPATRTPFPMDDDFSGRVVEEALTNHGVQVLRNMGFPGTWKVDSVVICPPYVVTEPVLGEIVRRLRAAVDVVSAPYLAKNDD